MGPMETLGLMLSGSIGLFIVQQTWRGILVLLRSRGALRSEKDALVLARSRWIERYAEMRRFAVLAGADPPEYDMRDEYDVWLDTHRPPIVLS